MQLLRETKWIKLFLLLKMKAASIKEIKSELETLPPSKLLEVCLRMTKFKKDNKELLSYLLFEEQDEEEYINNIKQEVETLFLDLNTKNLYIAKKNIRKIIRIANKFIKYSGIKTTEISIIIYLINKINLSKLPLDKSAALANIYAALIKKANNAIDTLHEDLQYDYKKELSESIK